MNSLIFFDTVDRNQLLPFTFTRPVADIRCGILTIREKWQHIFKTNSSFTSTENYLQRKFPLQINETNVLLNGHLIPDEKLIAAIKNLAVGDVLADAAGKPLAALLNSNDAELFLKENKFNSTLVYENEVQLLTKPHQIFSWNEAQINFDFNLLTKGKTSQPISSTNKIIAPENIFLEEGAIVEHSILNATNAKIYIAKDAEVMEGCMIRGSLALGEHSVLKMGAKVYGATTIGQHSKVGGEINNCVIFGFSNKAHDGFMGNSVIGEWCNWGADTNNSNLKNNYEEVKLWSYVKESFEKTGTQFCGLMMGDHSKCSINTMFNTGTVVGVSANIFGAGFPRNFIADFSWGGAGGTMTYQLNKAIQTAKLVYARRGMDFDQIEQDIFATIFNLTEKYRTN